MKLPLYTWILLVIIAVAGGVVVNLLARETPHGRLAGTLLAADTGLPLRQVAVTVSPAESSGRSYFASTDERGRFRYPHLPVGVYRLSAETKAHEQPGQPLTVREARTTSAIFELQPTEPYLRIFQRQRVFTTREAAKVRCHGFAPTGELAVRLFRLSEEALMQGRYRQVSDVLSLHGASLHTVDLSTIPQLEPVTLPETVARIRIRERDRDGEGVFRTEIAPGTLAPGVYLLSVEALHLRALAPLMVTDLGLIVKSAPEQALVYAVDIASGKAMPGAAVQTLRDGKVVATGATDPRGLATLTLPKSEGGSEMMVVGRRGKSLAVAHFYQYWGGGDDALRVYTYTDRPVYRPGHDVRFKSILRELHGDDYRVPANLAADVRVTDEQENLIYAGKLITSAFGTLAGGFALPADAVPGQYALTVRARGTTYYAGFAVAEYRKPEYEVEVVTPRKRFHRGQDIPATITARYFYGAPVPNAKVEYYVSRSQYWYYGEGEAWDADLYDGGYDEGEYLTSGSGKTNAAGMLPITIPAQRDAKDTQDWRYTITAYVTDESGRGVSTNAGVLVTQGAFRLEARPADWVATPGQTVAMRIHAVDYDGKPVAGASGTATFARVRWQDGRERLLNPVKLRWRAGADGRAEVHVTPARDGDYRLVVTAKDREGNRITGDAWLWVMSDAYADFDYPYQDIDVRADRDLYREGETAQIVVNTRFAPITALVTIEGPRLLEQRLVELKGKSTIIPVTIRPEFLPSVRASVSFLKGKRFYAGEAALNVSREKKALRIEITPDKSKYLPGEEAVYRVKTLAPNGKPVQAEVSLGLVDEAIYRIAPESADNIVSFFYPKREMRVQTAFSFPEIYLSGDDKAGATIRTRRRFLDTAFWSPTTVTDAQGQASFRLTLPDNLTTWRATARAATLDTRVGQQTAEAVVSQPFMVRLEPPRFFTQGDRTRVVAVAHNLSGRNITAQVGLNLTNAKAAADTARRIRLKDGATARLEWEVETPDIGEATLRVWGDAGRLEDAMELALPVLPRGREREDARRGAVATAENLRFEINRACIPGTQQLTVRLSPSLASAMLGSLEYLAHYPYGCVEQTMSAFLPDVVIQRTLRELDIKNPELDAELPKMVQAGLLKLYAMQHDDGGWGWWTYDETDPWMTAYVVFGLAQAQQAGYTVSPPAMQRGVAALKQIALRGQMDPSTRVFAAYALALAGQRGSAEEIVNDYLGAQGPPRLVQVNPWGQLMLAQAMDALGHDAAGRAIVTAQWKRFNADALTIDTGQDWWTEMDFAAALLYAGAALTPDDPRLPGLVRWVMERRQGNHWDSTRDTAFILYGLSRYLRHTRELQPDMQATVTVNGRRVAARRFTAADLFQPEFVVPLGPKDLKTGKVVVEIAKEGSGQLYYTASLAQVVALGAGARVDAGSDLRVERSYRKVNRNTARRTTDADMPAQTAFRRGDVIEVTLTVRAQRPYRFLMLEDPLPAGCEVEDRGRMSRWEWNSWWCDQIVRDQKVGFALRELRPGANRVTYYLTAQVPGTFTALPPRVFDMYRPARFGEGRGQVVTIR